MQRFARLSLSLLPAVLMTVTLASGLTADAQALRTEALVNPTARPVEAEAPQTETVLLLTGLAAIERDMMLGMLFLQDGLVSTVGSHFTQPRLETWPGIKDGLASAGIADFEGLLITLEAETDKAAVIEAQKAVIVAVLQAESALRATDQDRILAIVAEVQGAHDRFSPTGTTDVVDFQDGWAGLIVARGKVDLLMKSADPAVAKAALDMALAMDEVILALPDPAVSAPVAFDPAPVAALLARVEALATSV